MSHHRHDLPSTCCIIALRLWADYSTLNRPATPPLRQLVCPVCPVYLGRRSKHVPKDFITGQQQMHSEFLHSIPKKHPARRAEPWQANIEWPIAALYRSMLTIPPPIALLAHLAIHHQATMSSSKKNEAHHEALVRSLHQPSQAAPPSSPTKPRRPKNASAPPPPPALACSDARFTPRLYYVAFSILPTCLE